MKEQKQSSEVVQTNRKRPITLLVAKSDDVIVTDAPGIEAMEQDTKCPYSDQSDTVWNRDIHRYFYDSGVFVKILLLCMYE